MTTSCVRLLDRLASINSETWSFRRLVVVLIFSGQVKLIAFNSIVV